MSLPYENPKWEKLRKEIPQAMLTGQFATSAKCTKPPLSEEAAELFGVYSG